MRQGNGSRCIDLEMSLHGSFLFPREGAVNEKQSAETGWRLIRTDLHVDVLRGVTVNSCVIYQDRRM